MDDKTKTQQVNALKDQVALEHFVDELIKQRNDPKAKPEETKALLLRQINEAINTQLVNVLSEKDQVALDELLDKNPTDDELNAFFIEKIPSVEVQVASALLNFRAAYLFTPGEQVAVPPPPPPAPVPDTSN